MIEKIKTYIIGILFVIAFTGGVVSFIVIKSNKILKQD